MRADSRDSAKRIAAVAAIVILDDALEQLKRVFESLLITPSLPFDTLHKQLEHYLGASYTDTSFALAFKIREQLDGTISTFEAKEGLYRALAVRIEPVQSLLKNAMQVLNG